MKEKVRVLVYCSSCGQKLTGALKFCSSCGYKISKDELEYLDEDATPGRNLDTRVTFEQVDASDDEDVEDVEELKSAEVLGQPESDETPRPPGTVVKAKIPLSTRCSICGIKTDDICFFCDYAICTQHNVKLQISTDTGRFGNVIKSCPDCAGRKEHKQPTEEEAAENGFFFKIKPYHEWKIVE